MYRYEIEKTEDKRCVVLGSTETLSELHAVVDFHLAYYTTECDYTVQALTYAYCAKCEGAERVKTCRKKYHLHSDHSCYKTCPACHGKGRYPFYLDSIE